MSDHSWNLQQTIYTLLTGESPSIAGDRIYDDVPQNVTFPYVEIGDGQVIPDDTSSADEGFSEFIDLHVWSRYRGKKEIKQIFGQIHAALHGVALSVTGRASALSWVRNVRQFLDPDGVTRHGVVTVEVIHRS